ncbi:hypothetical protein Slala03_74340 [Streptomyces lavendulae subsp. lavendulae]|nr:hypothetical protein Slala03_74340 [Streptomyces lavendulae subsp. lavendulae]
MKRPSDRLGLQRWPKSHNVVFPDSVGNKPSACMGKVAGGACLSRESFHPKNAGTTGHAKVMEQKLRDSGYGAI